MVYKKIIFSIIAFILSSNLLAINIPIDLNASQMKKKISNEKDHKSLIIDEIKEEDIQKYTKVSLIDVILETVSNSYKIKAEEEKVRRAKINLDDSYAGYKPTIDLEYSYAKNQITPSDTGPDSGNHRYDDENLKLLLRQNLYDGEATSYKVKALEQSLQIAKTRYELAISTEIQNAINSYFGVVFSSRSLAITKRNMQMLRKILEIVTIRYDLGAATIGDISSIKASVANAETKLSQINLKFREALRYYKYIVGENFQYTMPYEFEYDISLKPLEDLLKEANEHNLNILSYLTSVRSEKYKLQALQSAYKPSLDLEVSQIRTFNKDIAPQAFYEQDTSKILLTLKYNLYNAGKDANAILKNYTNIRELQYVIEEERKKVQWIVSDIFYSLNVLNGTIDSTKQEVESSELMVDSYWEAFKNAEQDLQTLLIAQRQLNTAQVSLVESNQNRLSDYFKLLFETGQLVSFFDLDPTKENYIDFTKSKYQNKYYNNTEEEIKYEDTLDVVSLNDTSMMENETTKSESIDSLKDILLYKDVFLDAVDTDFTIFVTSFDSMYETLSFMKEYDLIKETFMVDIIEDLKLQNAIAYGIYNSYEAANSTLGLMKKTQDKKYEIVSIAQVKKLYKKFLDNLNELEPKEVVQQKEIIKTKIIKLVPKKPQPYFTDEGFKQEFINADKDSYTLNLATFSKLDDAISFVNNEQLNDKALIFKYGTNAEWIKILYGVFASYEDALTALNSLSVEVKEKYYPVIENIKEKQELYQKYSHLELGVPSASSSEVEYIQLSEDTKEDVNDIKTSTTKVNEN